MSRQHTNLERKMQARHVQMISMGGVIGTGLFLSSGYTIAQAGPLGTILSYIIGAVLVYLVMVCLGELAVAMPYTGAFHVYAKRYLGPATGFVVAILYWLTWTIALGSEFTGAGLIMQQWFPQIPVWIWSTLFIILIFGLNAFSVRIFAEGEFWLAIIKVIAILTFIVLGTLAIVHLLPLKNGQTAHVTTNLFGHGLFPNGVSKVFSTMLTVTFAFSGTELIGVTAGETKDPATTIPKAIHSTVWRLIIFFVGAIIVMAALIPYKEAGVSTSPFVVVFRQLGIPYVADIMNFVILTAIISTANSGLYASARMLWSLSNEGLISKKIAQTNAAGVPMRALVWSMFGGLLALLSSVIAADTLYVVLVSISGMAVMLVWVAIAASAIKFRQQFFAQGHQVDELAYHMPGYPVVPWLALIGSSLSVLLTIFDATQRVALYYTVPFVILCYLGYYLISRHSVTNKL
ncbi:S-methylmethionine transporter [Weissella beninensis]|uniref:Amino acid permease n=1 Tax=Periweissella beninensis TaxID=504936 RepID=A0ABT0VFX7_9LACO|nr:amino acid permease [Periweissella beninensis]MBM7543873.1 S-methylmethionine transporter [Periweissella beninensis]MCM2436746.1 amino acid permease [Periweissella beninensis]